MKTKHKQNHIYSAFLAMVMLFSLCVPAFAATANDAIVLIYQDDALIDADARNSDGNKDLLTVGALEVESLTVNGVAVSRRKWRKPKAPPPISVSMALICRQGPIRSIPQPQMELRQSA